MATPNRKITDADRSAAAKLRALWVDYKKKHPGTSQDGVAGKLGMSQAAFSQYLRGIIAIGTDALLTFATFFAVDPHQIRADTKLGPVPKGHRVEEGPVDFPSRLTDDAIEIALAWQALPAHQRQYMRDLLFMQCAVARHFPWLQVGRPDNTFEAFEDRLRKAAKKVHLKVEI